MGCGTVLYAALPEARGAELPSPPCPDCGRRMERHSRSGKTFQARMGPVRIERTYFRCRGTGFHQLDRTLGLEGRTVTPGAESLYADVASSQSCGQACRKLKNLAGVEVPKTTLLRHVAGIGEEMQAFERADAEASPAAERVLLGIDGTGVPMAYQFPTHNSVIISCALMVRFRCIHGTKIVHATRNLRIPRSGCRFDLWNPALRPLIRGLSGSAELSATRQQAVKVRNAELSVSY